MIGLSPLIIMYKKGVLATFTDILMHQHVSLILTIFTKNQKKYGKLLMLRLRLK